MARTLDMRLNEFTVNIQYNNLQSLSGWLWPETLVLQIWHQNVYRPMSSPPKLLSLLPAHQKSLSSLPTRPQSPPPDIWTPGSVSHTVARQCSQPVQVANKEKQPCQHQPPAIRVTQNCPIWLSHQPEVARQEIALKVTQHSEDGMWGQSAWLMPYHGGCITVRRIMECNDWLFLLIYSLWWDKKSRECTPFSRIVTHIGHYSDSSH